MSPCGRRNPCFGLKVFYSSKGIRSIGFTGKSGIMRGGSGNAGAALHKKTSLLLNKYIRGKTVKFGIPLDLSGFTAFQKAVFRAARRIPHGETRTYSWIARRTGHPEAARAAGNALGANPVPIIIPCHRVVRSDGSPGGFSGGLFRKKALLALERAEKNPGCCYNIKRDKS